MRFIDLVLAWPLWQRYDNIKEPWRLFLCLGIVLPPVWILNGAVKVVGWNPSILVIKTSAIILGYILASSMWKLYKITRD
jgi:hypothetical protein